MGIRRGPNIVTAGLVFYIDAANPGSYVSGSTTCTSLVSSATGSISGVTYASPPISASCWHFDDATDYIEIGAISKGPLYDIGTGDFTVNMWCAKDITSTYGWFISNFDSQHSGTVGFAMGVWDDTTSLYWRLYPGVWTDSGYNISSDLSFHNYTLTRNSGTVDVYVDAVLVDGANTGFTGTLAATEVPTYIGKRSDGYQNQPWIGNIAPVQIYNRGLTTNEVLQNYNALKGRFI